MKVKVLIEADVYRKVLHWVNKSQFEVSGLGKIKVEPDGVLRVVSAMLLPQKNGSTHTDIEADAVCKAMFELRDEPGELKWWWHSHVKMDCFWSGTDTDTIRSFGEGGWILATVFNQKYEKRSAFYQKDGQQTPWGALPLWVDEIETTVSAQPDPRTVEWDAEYERNVKISRAEVIYPEDFSKGVTRHSTTSVTPIKRVWTTEELESAWKAKSAKDRPKGMTKKDWKRLKAATNGVREQTSEEKFGVDAYGFTQAERVFLANEGFDEHDIDELLDHDFTGLEIIKLAEQGQFPHVIIQMMDENDWDVDDIMRLCENPSDGLPVADRRLN